MLIEDVYTNEWMCIPHFYFNLQAYQYVTGIAAGGALFQAIRAEGQAVADRFKDMLRAGDRIIRTSCS